jgi:hypothetical protein
MEFIDFFLNPQSEQDFEIISSERGKTTTRIPFFEGGIDYHSTLIRALEMTADETPQFKPQMFNEGEKQWLKKVELLNQEETQFNPTATFLENIGKELYQSLFPQGEKSENILKTAQQRANQTEAELHIQFRFEPESVTTNRVADYPWELIHDGEKFLAWHKVSFSRYIAYNDARPNLKPVDKINVLLISSEAFDATQNLKKLERSERKAIRKGLEKASQEGHINLIDLADVMQKNPTFETLQEYLTQQGSPHILHFDGHGLHGKKCGKCGKIHAGLKPQICLNQACGEPLPEAQGYLVFEDENGQPDYISAEKLGTTLQNLTPTQKKHNQGKLAVVVLSACQSGMALGGNSAFNGAAQKLIQHRIPAVVAMQYSVSIKAATQFAKQFYSALGQKEPLSAAIRQARIAMDIDSNQWYRPVLYLRWLDEQGGQLFADTEDAKVTKPNSVTDAEINPSLFQAMPPSSNPLIKIKQDFRGKLYKQLEAAYRRLAQVTGADAVRVQDEIDSLQAQINDVNQEITNLEK